MATYELELSRKTNNRIKLEDVAAKIELMTDIITKNPAYQFSMNIPNFPEPIPVDVNGKNGYKYRIPFLVSAPENLDQEILEERWASILKEIDKKSKKLGWELGGKSLLEFRAGNKQIGPRKKMVIPKLTPATLAKFFDGIYDRKSHIHLIHKAVETFLLSDGNIRSHLLLYGQPASAKTKLLERIKIFYEADENSDAERVVFIDGTTVTKAGLERWIIERIDDNNLPEILVLEEIEKYHMENLLSLLSVMASGYIARMNATEGKVQKKCKCLIFATCNNEKALKNFQEGALWSRFTHRYYCPRPSKDLMRLIVSQQIKTLPNGNQDWVEPIMQFAYNELKDTDPRTVLGLIDGRDDLLSGEYQKHILHIIKQERAEKSILERGLEGAQE